MVSFRRALSAAVLALLLPACLDDVGEGMGSRLSPLAAPGRLTATVLGFSTIRLSWEDLSSRETGHRIDVHSAPFDEHTAAVLDVVYLPADVDGHDYPTWPNRTLYFRVLALTESLESDPSNTASATTPPSAPKPYHLSTGPVTTSTIAVAWEVVGGELGSRVERSADGGATWTAVHDAGKILGLTDSGLLPGREYGYRVYSRDFYGLSVPSDPVWDRTQSTDWTVTSLVTGSSMAGMENAIAVRAGVEYITHCEWISSDIQLAVGRPGGTYTNRGIDVGLPGVSRGIYGTSIALDAGGAWHVAGTEYPSGDLRYVTNASGAVVATTIDSAGDTGHYPRIAVSPADGSIHVVYLEKPGTLRRAVKRSGAAWAFETIATVGHIGFRPSFVMDPTGAAHVLFSEWYNPEYPSAIHYGVQRGAGPWVLERTGVEGRIGAHSLAVDPAGIPHLSYTKHDASIGVSGLFVARREGGWVSEPVHVRRGQNVSLDAMALSPVDGSLHFAYVVQPHWNLRYARRIPGSAWTFRVLDAPSPSVLPDHLSIASGDGVVHITYVDLESHDLKRAVGAP